MLRAFLATTLSALLLSGCLAPPTSPSVAGARDSLLQAGLRELCENRPPASLEKLIDSHPHSPQAKLAGELLAWRHQNPQVVVETRKTSETELRELRDENRRLRSDLEQLRKLLIESERRKP